MNVPVAPCDYICGGQLTKSVPQPGADVRLDDRGDMLMARVVYRRTLIATAHTSRIGAFHVPRCTSAPIPMP